ncbi:MAG: hypothetical protein K8T20_02880 [Planctomycetes bacterium]|nr:hypothetical protein [Planctomycetota bacterium]
MTDAPDASPRRKWWLWLPLAFFGVILAFFILGSLVVSGRASSRWKEFLPRAAELKRRIVERDPRREPLEGPATPGDAWQSYVDATGKLRRMTQDEQRAIEEATYSRATPEMEAKGFAVLDTYAKEIEALRLAARQGSYRAQIDWADGFNAKLDWLSTFRQASRYLALSARRRRLQGDLDGAIDDVSAVLQLGIDCGHSGALICWMVGGFSIRLGAFQARDILEEAALTEAQAERVEKLAAGAEAGMASLAEALDGERLVLDETCKALAEGRAKLSDFGADNGLRLLAWRQGFSFRIVAAEVDDACLRLSTESARVAGRPWPEAAAAYAGLQETWDSTSVMHLLMPAPQIIDRSSRAVTARLRLLQAFAHERRTGLPMDPMPTDPFTLRPLHRLVTPGGVLWWSEWTDDDDGGKGKFDEDPDTDGDLPVEWVQKK